MGFKESIQQIAKTQELEDKINLAVSSVPVAKKDSISSARSIALQSGGGLAAGGAGSSNTPGTSNTGAPVTGNPGVPGLTDSAVQEAIKQSGAASALNAIQNAIKSGSSVDAAIKAALNDLSGNTAEVPNGGGGSAASERALNGYGNTEIQNVVDALVSQGLTTAEAAAIIGKYYESIGESGVYEIGMLMKGQAALKIYDPTAAVIDTIKGVLGISPDDPLLGLGIRFDGFPVYPSDADAAAAGQPSWNGSGYPAVAPDYIAGYFWRASAITTMPKSQTPSGAVQNYMNYLTGLSGGDRTYYYSDMVVSPNGPNAFTITYRIWNRNNTTGVVSGGTTGAGQSFRCDTASTADKAAFCPASPPMSQSAWPTTKIGMLNFQNGKVTFNPFDTEVPPEYKSTPSSVKLKSSITGDTYLVEQTNNGGFMVTNPSAGASEAMLVFGADRTLRNVLPASMKPFYSVK